MKKAIGFGDSDLCIGPWIIEKKKARLVEIGDHSSGVHYSLKAIYIQAFIRRSELIQITTLSNVLARTQHWTNIIEHGCLKIPRIICF